MFSLIWKFFCDPDTFTSAFGRLQGVVSARANYIRGALFAIALGVVSGVEPFKPITDWLGSLGTIGSAVLVVLAVTLKAGDQTPPQAAAFVHANPQQLLELLKRIGVNDDVAKAAAAGEPIPKSEAK